MRHSHYILLCFFTCLFIACEKKNVNEPEGIVPTGIFDQIWATRMNVEHEIVNLTNGLLYKDWFLRTGDKDLPPTLYAFDKHTGEKVWEKVFDQFENDTYKDYIFKDTYISNTHYDIFCVDLDTKEILWQVDFRDEDMYLGRARICENGLFYIKADYASNSPNHEQRLLEMDLNTGEYRIVYSNQNDEKGHKYMSLPVYLEISGIPHLIFNEYPNSLQAPENAEQNLVAINLVTGEYLWKVEDFTENFYGSAGQYPVVYENLVITGGDWSIYAFNFNTGEQVWRYTFDYPWSIFNKTNHLIYKDRLYVNNGQYDVTCLNPLTGDLVWNNPEAGPNSTDNMIYYEKEDFLLFTAWGYGSVMILDGITGETIYRERGYDDSSYNNDVVYDSEADMFYCSTYKHAVGFKVNGPL